MLPTSRFDWTRRPSDDECDRGAVERRQADRNRPVSCWQRRLLATTTVGGQPDRLLEDSSPKPTCRRSAWRSPQPMGSCRCATACRSPLWRKENPEDRRGAHRAAHRHSGSAPPAPRSCYDLLAQDPDLRVSRHPGGRLTLPVPPEPDTYETDHGIDQVQAQPRDDREQLMPGFMKWHPMSARSWPGMRRTDLLQHDLQHGTGCPTTPAG